MPLPPGAARFAAATEEVTVRKAILALLAILIAIPAAHALPRGYTGTDLLQNCATDTAVCDIYLLSLVDAHDAVLAWSQSPSRICPPRSMEPAELWAALRTRLLTRPERLGASAGSLVLDALQVTYPCAGRTTAAMPTIAPQSGVELAERCTNAATCEPALVGALDAHQTLVDWQRIPKPYLCLANDSTIAQWRVALLRYLQAHLDQLGFSAGSLTLLAMAESHPC